MPVELRDGAASDARIVAAEDSHRERDLVPQRVAATVRLPTRPAPHSRTDRRSQPHLSRICNEGWLHL